MMRNLPPDIALAALNRWGLEAQLRQMQEECAELIAAISHFLRHSDGGVFEVAEEMADVRIVLDQCWPAFEKSEQYMQIKVDKLRNKLDDTPQKEVAL